jgi:iron(III) transport system ATP-binding protein
LSSIACHEVSKSFGRSSVLDRLELEVPDASVVTVLGESGSGKTTLLRLIAGFERPDSGTISIDEEVVDSPRRFVPPERRGIGYVAQEGNLFTHLTVAKNVAFGLSRRERTPHRIEQLLDLVGLGDLGRRYPHELSGGQQQRVALARALAPHPKVVLLDEPFSSLDAGLRASLRFDVMRILREQEATTVFVTHDQEEALSVSDLVGIMRAGRIRQFASPQSLYSYPVDPAIAQFLGEANLVAGDAVNGVVDTAFGRIPVAGADDVVAGPAVVLIRPEQLVLHQSVPGVAAEHPVTGSVVHREYYGHHCIVLVDAGVGESPLRIRCAGPSSVEVGDSVSVTVRGEVVAWRAPAADRSA